MKEKMKVYEGSKPFIFISYARKDKAKILPIIQGLRKRRYRVWFDRGIHGGKNWLDVLDEKVDRCAVFILFVSRHYVNSDMCKAEVSLAKELKKTIIPIYLEEVELDGALRLALAGIQALMPNQGKNAQDLWEFVEMAENLACCKEDGSLPSSDDWEDVPVSPLNIGEIKAFLSEKFQAFTKWLAVALLMLLLALIIVEKMLSPGDMPSAQSQPKPTETQTQTVAPTESAESRPSAPQTLSGNVMMEVPSPAEKENLQNTSAFGTSITRAQVGSIWFRDIENGIPANAEEEVDISQNQDGSVLAWTVKDGDLYQLHIAGKGGVDAPVNSANLFRDMVNLSQIYFFDAFFTANAESMKAMFYNCEKLIRVDVSGFNTAKVKNFGWMFANCQSLDKLDVSSFDTSCATRMTYMFSGCRDLWELDLRGFRTENVTDMQGMFRGCEELISLNIESFDTGHVKNMSTMFYQCRNLVQLDVSHFDTANVTDMGFMFSGCEKVLELDVDGFDTANVTDMNHMFSWCSKISALDVAGFDTRHVTNMSYMFTNCSNLEELDVSSFRTFNVTDMSYMFYNNPRLDNLDFSNFNTDKVTAYENFMLENQKINGIPWQGLFANVAQ